MKVLFTILLGTVIGLGAMYLTAGDYSTSDESNMRLYENVVAKW